MNDKPASEGAWDVTITPIAGNAFTDLQYAKWVTDRDGQNMENFGVPPDVFIDNTPDDFLKDRDMQIEKAVEALKADLGRKSSTSQQ